MPRSRNRYYQGPVSEHFDGTRFFNPGQPSTDRGLVDVLRWRLTSAAARWPKSVQTEIQSNSSGIGSAARPVEEK